MKNIEDKTIEFYEKNSNNYFKSTLSADMSEAYNRFITYVKPDGVIIDLGMGSGRDIKYFMQEGFVVHGIDASEELCRLAIEYTGAIIQCQTIQKWEPQIQYDGVWANASLIHLSIEEVKTFIERLPRILSNTGVLYISIKEGKGECIDEHGRYFNGVTLGDIEKFIKNVKDYLILDTWISEDTLLRTNIKWRNIIIGSTKEKMV